MKETFASRVLAFKQRRHTCQQQIHEYVRTISTSHYSLKLLSDGSRLEAFAPLAIIAAIEKSVAPTLELPLMIFVVAVAVLVAAAAVVAKTPD